MSIELASGVSQCGAKFYRDIPETADSNGEPVSMECIAHYPGVVQHDYDMVGAIRAREKFAAEFPEHIESKPAFYSVGIYHCERAYGGPEEGGWYYDAGNPLGYVPEGCEAADLCRLFASEADAMAWRDELEAKLTEGPNKGRRPISSVLSDGVFRAVITGGYPRAFPESRPYYE